MNDDEWGNIELPGLSDEELYSKNWNKVPTKAHKEYLRQKSKEFYKDPKNYAKWLEKQKEAIKNRSDEWRDNVAEANRKKYQDPAFLENLKQSLDNRSDEWRENVSRARSEMNADPEVKAAHIKRMKERHKDPEYKKTLAKGIANRSDEWRQNVIAANKATQKPVITPYGEFEGINDAKRKGLKTIEGCMKRMPHLFYYKEEGPGEATYETVIVSDLGEFRNLKQCFETHKNNGDPVATSMWSFKEKGAYKKVKMPCREWINRFKGQKK